MRHQHGVKRINSGGWLLMATLSMAMPVHANDGVWMMLGDGNKLESGNKPDRVMHYANAARISDRTDQSAKIAEIMRDSNPKTIDARVKALEINEMDIVEIHENPGAPGIKVVTMQFHCGRKEHRVVRAEAIERNHLHRFSDAGEWRKYVPTDWQSRAWFIACFPEVWVPLVKADQAEMKRTGKVTKQADLREYGVAMVGNWSHHDGLMQAYRFTWDKLWAADATPAPFHHNRTAAEEKEYQAWKRNDDAVIAENERNAPMLESAISGLEAQVEGQLKGMDEEKIFQDQIAANFKKHKSKYFGTFRGLTEEQLVDVRGVPTSMTTNDGLRSILYAYTTDTRHEVDIRDGEGNLVGTDIAGQLLGCSVTFKLRVGGNKPEYRVVDYVVDRDMTTQGYAHCE